MNNKFLALLIFTLLAAVTVGCGTATAPIPAATQPPQIITVVITATPPPPTATSPAPSITPVPTVPLTATVALALTQVAVKPTTSGAPKPAPTRTPTRPAVTLTPTALPMKFAAPVLIEPIWTDDRRDERKFPSGALIFKWRGQTGMSGDECYLVTVTFSPVNVGPGSAQDSFLWGCNGKTTINSLDGSEDPPFRLNQPNREGPNYGSLLIGASEIWVDWTVTLVKNLGQCTDEYHCKTAPISPPGRGRFLLRGS